MDYRDAFGRRRWESYRTKQEAESALATALPASRQRLIPAVDPNVIVRDYAERWLTLCGSLKPSTLTGYREKLNLHILPTLGPVQLRRLHRGAIKDLLARKKASGLSIESVRLIYATLRAMLSAALDDGVIPANPAAGIGRSMRLSRSAADRREEIRAFDADQLDRFLAASQAKVPRFHLLLFTLSRTGLRLGEALALKWEDVDLVRRELRVERALTTRGEIDTPKSGHGRTVDLSAALCDLLRSARARAAEAAMARGGRPEYLFPNATGEPTPHVTAEGAFRRALKTAELPGHFSPHSLRHTYASVLLSDGVSPAYVQEQLGHASIELTVGTYGRWLRKKAPGAVDRLDGVVAKPAEVVAAGPTAGDPAATSGDMKRLGLNDLAERGGFEPPVQVYPAQQISNLSCSATPAPLREEGWRPGATKAGATKRLG